MPAPISNTIREKIIFHKENQEKESDIAKWLIISQSTVTKVWALYKTTGSYLPQTRTQGRKPLVDDSTMEKVTAKISITPDATLSELIEEFNLPCSESALCRRLKKLGYSFKKRQLTRQNKTVQMCKRNAKSSLKT
jgi:transposase